MFVGWFKLAFDERQATLARAVERQVKLAGMMFREEAIIATAFNRNREDHFVAGIRGQGQALQLQAGAYGCTVIGARRRARGKGALGIAQIFRAGKACRCQRHQGEIHLFVVGTLLEHQFVGAGL